MQDQAVYSALLNAGIESLPLSIYCATPLQRQGIVLGFCCAQENRIPGLVNQLFKVLEKFK
jgi:GntR family transcriptional regulator/MocR family aminotransferase